MPKRPFQFIFWTFCLGLIVFFVVGEPKSKYRVCYYDVIEKEPTCVAVAARHYTLAGGCAKFDPNDEAVCGILLITKVEE